ncbi:condensation domain-containing protein [Micromonospora tarensis]|uniref:AMP-binding protein n=1 Tax=Micromonospora tarensis TaxID=2806100 RepID=A0ABS1YAK6_9ACTN|nr:condensation domain-containing protein [Micromonospora tarensis]MBM0274429.1 AMP-binding protein [Micromonospora tarensis]
MLPLAPLQAGLLFHARYDERGVDLYNVQLVFDLTGELDRVALRRAAETVLRRHENLRAEFRSDSDGQPVQAIHRAVEVPWVETDLRGLADDALAAELDRLTAADLAQRFELRRPPLIRFIVVRTGEQKHRLLVTHHHILLDGWSGPIMLGELFALYGAGGDDSGLPPVVPFRNYLAWLAEQDPQAAAEAWRAALAGLDEPTLVAPARRDRPPMRPDPVARLLPARTTALVGAQARRHGLTLNTVVQGAWGLLLCGLTGRRDVVFGETVNGRPTDVPGVDRMVGLFVNTLPVRVRVEPADTLLDVLVRLREQQLGLLPFQHLGLGEIQRLAGHSELFDTATVFENFPVDVGGLAEATHGLGVVDGTIRDATHYPLALASGQTGQQLSVRLYHRTDVFDADTVALLAQRLEGILEAFAADPQQPVTDAEALPAAEREQVLTQWHGPVRPVPSGGFAELFDAALPAWPDRTAVTDVASGRQLTYAELAAASTRLAVHLADQGVGPESVVAVVVPRSALWLTAMLAVWRAGGSYVPVDAELPAERLSWLLADAAPALVLTVTSVATAVSGAWTGRTIVLDDAAVEAAVAARAATAPPVRLRPEHAAYMIYTSGSTGTPKGVVVSHAGLPALAGSHAERLSIQPGDRVLQAVSPSFDPSIGDVAMTLLSGATLVLAPGGRLRPATTWSPSSTPPR